MNCHRCNYPIKPWHDRKCRACGYRWIDRTELDTDWRDVFWCVLAGLILAGLAVLGLAI